MNRQRLTLLALGVVVLVAGTAAAQAPKPATPEPSGQAPAAKPRFVPPVRGEAPLGYTKPIVDAKGKDFIVTTMKIKNLATGSVAGLRINEIWVNKAGETVTGANYRHPRPLQPGEIITVTLRTPRNAAMDRNQYEFQHANGTIKMTLLPKL
jgi:hypothetical protein